MKKMNGKSTIAKVATLGLLTTTFAFGNLEIATFKTGSTFPVGLELSIGKPASALKCRKGCVKAIFGVGGRMIKQVRERQRQQEQ